MSVLYRIADCTNPAGTAGTEYKCVRETAADMVDIEAISESISEMCSMTPSDVKGILSAYLFQIGTHVSEGSKVTIDKIGTFRPGIKSKAFAQSEITTTGFKPSSKIYEKMVKFYPNKELRAELRRRVVYEKATEAF